MANLEPAWTGKTWSGSFPGIFARLSEEHREVAALLEQLSQDEDPKLRRGLFPEVRDKLLAHEEGELMELYTCLRRDPRTRAIAETHDRSAGELRVLVDALSSLEPNDPDWPSALARLREALTQHAAEEEGSYFPEASALLGPEEAMRLEQSYMVTKQRVLERFEQLATVTAAT
jgi:hemerythrin superfamily protein